MADKTGIKWTNATWNPVVGCTIESPACAHCYAMIMAARIVRMARAQGRVSHYEGTTRDVKGHPVWTGKLARAAVATLLQPIRYSKPRRIFVNSMSDLFHPDMPVDWIDDTFAVMVMAEAHLFQVLTKRPTVMRAYMTDPQTPERIAKAAARLAKEASISRVAQARIADMSWPPPNVWLGCTVEDQKRAVERLPILCTTPAALRFVSIEPMLSFVHLSDIVLEDGSVMDALRDGVLSDGTPYSAIGWAIVGGESGEKVRAMHPAWPAKVRDDCETAGVPYFFKQWGVWSPSERIDQPGEIEVQSGTNMEPSVWMRRASRSEDVGDVLGGRRHLTFPKDTIGLPPPDGVI